MFAADTYRIRLANDEDIHTLRDAADRSSEQRLDGPVLVGEIDGVGTAALSLNDRLLAPRNPEVGPRPTASARQVLTFKNRVLVAAAVVVASYVPAASALALAGANHNETLLLDA